MNRLLIYGANGYSAKLILTELLSKNIQPVLAGRNANEIAILAQKHTLSHRIFDLKDDEIIKENLKGIHTVLNCAGPYKYTAKDLIDACLECGVNYIDITGEIPVFALAFANDSKAKSKGISILPGAGFDIIPTDCLAKKMSEEMPDASCLKIAFYNKGGKISRGTFLTTLEFLDGRGKVRRCGKVIDSEIGEYKVHVNNAVKRKTAAADDSEIKLESEQISFDAISIPWGDVFTAYYSTGIQNITVYLGVPRAVIFFLPLLKILMKIFKIPLVKKISKHFVQNNIVGPDKNERETARTYIWCRVENAKGEFRESIYRFMEGYTLTASGAAEIAERVLNGKVSAGTLTPSMAFGSNFMERFIL